MSTDHFRHSEATRFRYDPYGAVMSSYFDYNCTSSAAGAAATSQNAYWRLVQAAVSPKTDAQFFGALVAHRLGKMSSNDRAARMKEILDILYNV